MTLSADRLGSTLAVTADVPGLATLIAVAVRARVASLRTIARDVPILTTVVARAARIWVAAALRTIPGDVTHTATVVARTDSSASAHVATGRRNTGAGRADRLVFVRHVSRGRGFGYWKSGCVIWNHGGQFVERG